MFLLLATLLAAPAPIATALEVRLGTVTGGTTAILVDGQTASFVLEAAPDNLEMVIASQLRGGRAHVVRLPRGSALVEIRAAHPVLASRIVSGSDDTLLVLDLEQRADAVRRRAMTAIPRSVPSEFVGPRVRHADAAVTAGRLEEARQRFSELANEYSLRSWAELRLGDIDLVGGLLETACADYRHVVAEFPQRTAGLVAKMRLHGLECVQSEQVAIDWVHLMKRLRYLDGPVGRYLLREAAWVLHVTRDPEIINSALATSSPTARRPRLRVPAQLRHALLARAIRHSDTFSTAKACFAHRAELLRHPESRSLLLTCARATLDLDLPDTAVELIQEIDRRRGPAPGAWQQSRGDLRTLVVLSRAYEAAGRTYLSRRAAVRYRELAGEPAPLPPERIITPADLEVGDSVAQLQARVDALRAHLDGEATR